MICVPTWYYNIILAWTEALQTNRTRFGCHRKGKLPKKRDGFKFFYVSFDFPIKKRLSGGRCHFPGLCQIPMIHAPTARAPLATSGIESCNSPRTAFALQQIQTRTSSQQRAWRRTARFKDPVSQSSRDVILAS